MSILGSLSIESAAQQRAVPKIQPKQKQMEFTRCKKCNPTKQEAAELRATQKAASMNFVAYSDAVVTAGMLSGPEFRAMVETSDPQFAKLCEKAVKEWLRLEYGQACHLMKFAFDETRKMHRGNAWSQDQHDCVSLANRKKYCAFGSQFIFDSINWTVCLGFKHCKSGKAEDVAKDVGDARGVFNLVPTDFVGHIQDFADLAVA